MLRRVSGVLAPFLAKGHFVDVPFFGIKTIK
jgi:hypothetical protein